MTALGNYDFLSKASGPVDFLTSISVNTSTTQSTDITSLVAPSHNGILLVWVAALASVGQAINVEIDASLNGVAMVPKSTLGDGKEAAFPFYGAYINANPGNTCTVVASPLAGDPTPVLGTLLVFALNTTPLVNPAIRHDLIGRGTTTGNKTVTAGTTATVLAAPTAGTYYRIKALGWSLNVAPAAATKFIWQDSGTGAVILGTSVPVAASQMNVITLDLEWDSGIAGNNQTSLNIPCTVVYEVWNY